MTPAARRWLLWTPRVLAILVTLFITMFVVDVFSAAQGFWRTLAAFLIHCVPTFLILLALALAWRRAWVGGLAYIVLGVAYILTTPGRPSWWLIIAGPLFLVGVLFLASWFYRREPQA
jgi:hypothetical protein